MAEAEPTTIRLRHYTRVSSKNRILTEKCLIVRDQNKVFIERADRKLLSPREAEAKYLLKRGKGNAYIELDALPDEVHEQTNPLTRETELFLWDDVNLSWRHSQGFDNV